MIDTVSLVFDIGDPKLRDIFDPNFYDKWSINLGRIFLNGRQKGPIKSMYVDKQNKATKVYCPRLTIFKQYIDGGFICRLYIEFSAPKLLFGNNFDELQESDFPKLCYVLRKRLQSMGIKLTYDQTWNAKVQTIHFGKNVVFTDGTIPTTTITHLKNMDISLKKRIHEKDYKNGGEALYIGTNKHQLCIYDKRKELENAKITEKDNSEKDSWCQTDIFSRMSIIEPFQVLRLESRSRQSKTIVKTLENAGICTSENPTFVELFKSNTARAVLKWELDTLTKSTPKVILMNVDPLDQVDELVRLNPKAKAKDILCAVALSGLLRTHGSRTTRNILPVNSQQWSNLKREVNKLKSNPPPYDKLFEVRHQIDEFKPVKLRDYCQKNAIIKGEYHGKNAEKSRSSTK